MIDFMLRGIFRSPEQQEKTMMNKKIISCILSLTLFCGLTLDAAAAGFEINSDSEEIKAGEQITMTIVLDETIPASDSITNVQGELYYDTEVFHYVSHQMSDEYSQYISTDMPNKNRFQFSNTSMSNTPYEVPAGTILTITFFVNENLSLEELESVFQLKMKMSTDKAVTTTSETEWKVAFSGNNKTESHENKKDKLEEAENPSETIPETAETEDSDVEEQKPVEIPVTDEGAVVETMKPALKPETDSTAETKPEQEQSMAKVEKEDTSVKEEKVPEDTQKQEESGHDAVISEKEEAPIGRNSYTGKIFLVVFALSLVSILPIAFLKRRKR